MHHYKALLAIIVKIHLRQLLLPQIGCLTPSLATWQNGLAKWPSQGKEFALGEINHTVTHPPLHPLSH